MTAPNAGITEQGRAIVLAWQRAIDAAAARVWTIGDPATEYEVIQNFMYNELFYNSNSEAVARLKELNARLDTQSKMAAYGLWAAMVAQGAEWDHKQRILNMAGGKEFTPVMVGGGRSEIRYDFWSNMHYGYVGIEAGFTAGELRAGADLADLLGRDRTDPGDDAAIRAGIELRARYGPGELEPRHLQEAITLYRDELTRTGMLRAAVG